jgi:phenylalanyl-tRNA synthetase alpha chain
MSKSQEIRGQFLSEIKENMSFAEADALRVKYLGKKGIIIDLRKDADFSKMPADEKKNFGRDFNELKQFVEEKIQEILKSSQQSKKKVSAVDLTLPGTDRHTGCMHPNSLVQLELGQIFESMGFRVFTGHEVEQEFYNFDGLNIPSDHPAREMQDTYWLENGMLLRTHTSASQVRALKKFGAPLRAIFPGRCFRYESVDAGHENTFYQLEGLMIDKQISIANLIGVMKITLSRIFKKDVPVRLRPGFFPFVEPGFELDIRCLICGGKGCPTCKKTGWVELLPCGLVHPNVLENGGINSKEYSGFAFGLGLSRLAMMKYGIPEIRLFNSGDIRFYQQFPASL